jgi:type IV secretory pathway component VirB8
MNNKFIDNELNKLEHIQKADAHPFVFTRIQAKIYQQNQRFGPKLVWKLSIAMVFILLINAVVITVNLKSKKQENNLAKAMQLIPNNELY